jgi:diaminopimelate decarboxylase
MSLDLCREFPTVETLNLGGGYKVGRMAHEKSTDLAVVGAPVKALFEAFAKETGRALRLEIEPGTFLLANSCAIVCTVQDKVSTKTENDGGHVFLKLDAGMTEVLRPSLYAAQARPTTRTFRFVFHPPRRPVSTRDLSRLPSTDR